MLTGRSLVTRLRTLAQTDHLTRLPRRDILNEALLQEHDYLMILDIDNFKSVNDTHGHGVGDLALVAFAHALIGDGDIPGMKIGNAYRVPKINVIRYALSAGNPQPAA